MSFKNVRSFIARVTNNSDPEYRGRIKVLIVGVHQFPAQNTQPQSYYNQQQADSNYWNGSAQPDSQLPIDNNTNQPFGGGAQPDSQLSQNSELDSNFVGPPSPTQNPDGNDGSFAYPVAGDYKVNSEYGNRIHPIYKENKFHGGVDIPAPGGTPILSSQDGVVVGSAFGQKGSGYGGYGNYVIVDHGNGIQTFYSHMQGPGAAVGTIVKRGDQIGKVGTTGASTGNHLHYEVWKDGTKNRVDPSQYLSGSSKTSASNVKQPSQGGYSSSLSSMQNGLGAEGEDQGVWAICSYPIIFGGIPKRGTLPAPQVQIGAIVHGISLDGDAMQELIVLGIIPRHEVVDKLSRNETGASAGSVTGMGGNGNVGSSSDQTAAGNSTNDLLNSPLCNGNFALGDVVAGQFKNETGSWGTDLSRNQSGGWDFSTNYSGAGPNGIVGGSGASGPGQMFGGAAMESLKLLIKQGNQDFINNINQKFGTNNLTKEQLLETLQGSGETNRQIQLSLSAGYAAYGFNNYGFAGGLVNYYGGDSIARVANTAYQNGGSLTSALNAADEAFKQNSRAMSANKGFLPSQYATRVAKSMGFNSLEELDAACKAVGVNNG